MSDPSAADPYWKLRPPPPTPADELCACGESPPVMLAPHLSENPLSCFDCNLEVPPERLGFGADLAEALASWRTFHDCFFLLWLDSGEFESWARAQLEDPSSSVNSRARELVARLNAHVRAYQWWFQGEDAEEFQPLEVCPLCQGQFVELRGRNVCDPCSIVVAV